MLSIPYLIVPLLLLCVVLAAVWPFAIAPAIGYGVVSGSSSVAHGEHGDGTVVDELFRIRADEIAGEA